MRAPKFPKGGTRVRLRMVPVGDSEFPEGLPEEIGETVGDYGPEDVPEDPTWPIMYVVRVDRKQDPFDDRLREVGEDQMEAE